MIVMIIIFIIWRCRMVRNKGLILLSTFLFSFIFCLNIDAATAGTTTTSVNVRKSATTASAKVVTLAKGKNAGRTNPNHRPCRLWRVGFVFYPSQGLYRGNAGKRWR